MIRHKDDEMGRFSVELNLANYEDLVRARNGDIGVADVRRAKVLGVVDSGATRLVLPPSVVERLGLRLEGQAGVRFADGRRGTRDIATGIHLTYGDRSSVFNAIVEPGREDALIGAIVREDLDLIIDCTHATLVPRDPDRIISEIE